MLPKMQKCVLHERKPQQLSLAAITVLCCPFVYVETGGSYEPCCHDVVYHFCLVHDAVTDLPSFRSSIIPKCRQVVSSDIAVRYNRQVVGACVWLISGGWLGIIPVLVVRVPR